MDDYTRDWDKVFEERNIQRQKEQVRAKSVGRKPTRKGNIKVRIIAIALAASLAITGGIHVGNKLKGKFEKAQKADEASTIVKNEAQKILLNNGLATYDDKGNVVIKNNSVDDYEKLDIDEATFEELYAYFLATNKNSIEFGKLIQSVQGVDGVHHYINLSQFYSYNGFDKGTEGGFVEWETYSRNKLVEAYENGTIEDIVREESNTKGR